MSEIKRSAPFSRYPDWGKLTVALIEHAAEPLLGKDSIEIIGAPYSKRQLFNELRTALARTEKEYIQHNQANPIASGLIQLPLSNLDSVGKALWHFIENPASSELEEVIYQQFYQVSPRSSDEDLLSAVKSYLSILKRQIVKNITEEIWRKLNISTLLSIESHVESMDNNLRAIHHEIKNLAEFLSGLYQQGAAINNLPSTKTGIARKQTLPLNQFEKFEEDLEFSLREEMSGLEAADVKLLHQILAEWIVPVLDQNAELGGFDRPYGFSCLNILERMVPKDLGASLFQPQYDEKREFNEKWAEIFNNIFKSDMAGDYPGETKGDKCAVRLESLSRRFPVKIDISEPYGFYLIDRGRDDEPGITFYEPRNRRNSLGSKPRPRPAKSRYFIIYISRKDLNGWVEIARSEKDVRRPKSWRDKAGQFFDALGSAKQQYSHSLLYGIDELTFLAPGLDSYYVTVDQQRFTNFVLGVAEDFLSLASRTILAERKIRTADKVLKRKLES